MKTALVTGGSRGIGAAIAHRLSADGFRVCATSRRPESVTPDPLLLERDGFYAPFAAEEAANCVKLVDTVLEKFCQLDILVCNAGVSWRGLTQDMSEEDYRYLMAVDLDAAFYCCKAVLPHMIRRKSGKIVLISSMWGQVGGACEVAYSAAKAGLIGLTKALAKEVGPSGITVNCVAPGVIDTEMNQALGPQALADLAEETPLGRLGSVQDVAGCVSYLCSDDGGFLTGQVIAPNGGLVI